jgi:hypothetical protein
VGLSSWFQRFRRLRKPIRYAIDPQVQGLLNENHALWQELPKRGYCSTFEYFEKVNSLQKHAS